MSQGRIVTVDGSLGGRIVWVEMSRGRFVGGRIVWAPTNATLFDRVLKVRQSELLRVSVLT
jgi:hypothetical protein